MRVWVFALLVVAHIYFLNAHPRFESPNVSSRVYMTLAIVDSGNLQIDPYLALQDCQDKALYRGHYYSDKAPGLSLWLVPCAWIVRHTFFPAPDLDGITIALRMLGLSLPMVLFWWLACREFERVAGSERAALALTLAGALGTNFFIYATNLFGHALAGALLFASFMAARRLDNPRGACAAGLLLAAAFVTDYVVMLAVAVLGCYALWTTRRRPVLAAAYAVGAALPLCLWMWLNKQSYGGPLTVGFHLSADDQFRKGYQSGLGGIQWPDPRALIGMWFSRQRGLAFLSPILLLSPIGLYRLCRDPSARSAAWLAIAIIVGLALFTSTTLDWTGGWGTGVRYMVPAIPFLLWGAAACLRRTHGEAQTYAGLALCALALPGFLLVGAAAATFPFLPGPMVDPLFHFAVPVTLATIAGRSVLDLAGIHASALPFFLLLVAAFAALLQLSFPDLKLRLKHGLLALGLAACILGVYATSSPARSRVDVENARRMLSFMGYGPGH